MKNVISIRKLLLVILSISIAGILYAGLGCEKHAGIEEALPEITYQEEEPTEEVEEPEEVVEPAEVLATDAFGDQIVFVTEDGTGDGTKDNPMKDINQAIAHAKATWSTPSAVVVAEGTYNVDWSNDTHIKMVKDVSLYGGFSKDWKNRGPSYITTIKNTSTSGQGVPDDPDRAVEFKSGITEATVIDGFLIKGGGSGTGSSAAIFTDNASPTISNNDLDGGSADKSVGVYNVTSSPVIYNNTIYGGGGGSSSSYGISVNGDSPKIYNNTIDGGGGSKYSLTIFTYNGGSPWIYNNIIFSSTSGSGYGIYEYDASSDPQEVKNNDFFNCSGALYYDFDSVTKLTTKTAINNLVDIIVKDNVDDNAKLISATDWHLQASSPPAVTGGGLDGEALNWGFTTDKDGKDRTGDGTTGWSMGAYEYE